MLTLVWVEVDTSTSVWGAHVSKIFIKGKNKMYKLFLAIALLSWLGNSKAQVVNLQKRYQDVGQINGYTKSGLKEGLWIEEPDTIFLHDLGVSKENSVQNYFYGENQTASEQKGRVQIYTVYQNGIPSGCFQYVILDTVVVEEGCYDDGKVDGYVTSLHYRKNRTGELGVVFCRFTRYSNGVARGVQASIDFLENRMHGIAFNTYENNLLHGLEYNGGQYSLARKRKTIKYFPLYKDDNFIYVNRPYLHKNKEGRFRAYEYEPTTGKVSLSKPHKYSWLERVLDFNRIRYPLKKIAKGEISTDEVNFDR